MRGRPALGWHTVALGRQRGWAMIAVLGAGAMGCAVATHLARAGERVVVLATDHDDAAVRAWRCGRPHPVLGVVLDRDIAMRPLAESLGVLADVDIIVAAVATPGLVPTLSLVRGSEAPGTIWVLATKGWQEDTLFAPSQVAASLFGEDAPVVTLAGPGLATEIVAGSPTALLCASHDRSARRRVADTLSSPSMLIVTTSDVAGAETASAYKNVVAIAVGIAEGLSKRFMESALVRKFDNARAAMFAQGMIDMVHLAEARGGHAATILGLAGAGDLYVTCVGGRNGRFGQLLGSGTPTEQALRIINSTVEGVANTKVAVALADRYGLDLRTARAVDLALRQELAGEDGVQHLRQLFTDTMWPQYALPTR